MSTDGDDPKDKKPQPPSTLAGVVPQQPPGRPGLPPPRSTHGGPPRPGSSTSRPPFNPGATPRPTTPTGSPRPGTPSQSPPFSQSGATPR
ncbi:MAG TPA: hypothetical protein VFV99_03390, partial [Kofleriaceae bacterium]|nr:hypothetical protein [Kofleriaceae bacterium]